MQTVILSPQVLRLTSTLALATLLTACGGGGGGGTAVTPPPSNPVPPPDPACKVQILADASVEQGKTAAATVLSCGAPLRSVVWTQTGGPATALLAARSPTVALETAQAGVLALRADVTLADGSAATASTSISVNAAPAGSFVTVRADHAMRPETDTSLRAWPNLSGSDTLKSVTWTQTAGPAVSMNTSDELVLTFKAPKADKDTLLKFRATMTTSSGRVDTDDVMVSIDPQGPAPDGYIFDATARVHPYRSASKYAPVLARCAYDISLYFKDNGENNFCPSSDLPLLHADTTDGMPTVEQVMARVLVSHDFLGDNFHQFLLTQDPQGDFRRMLAGVSAIVIGSHVRPSFYTAATGAIYLDANFLWLSAAQRDVVTEVPDYRLAYAEPLNFSTVGRMVRGNTEATTAFPDWERTGRGIADLPYRLGRLLYHELAHAADFFPPSDRALTPTRSIWDNAVSRISLNSLPSDVLATTYPLRSAEWKGLGQVLYQGATPTEEQKSYTAAQVGAFFGSDVASDDYAYSIYLDNNSREDLAMLFEEFMMAHRHGVRYDVAYTNKWTDNLTSDQLVVAWGQRGRIGDARIKPRVKLVVQRIAPWIAGSAVDSLAAPVQFRAGATWSESLFQASSPRGGVSARRIESPAQRAARTRSEVLERHAHGRHGH